MHFTTFSGLITLYTPAKAAWRNGIASDYDYTSRLSGDSGFDPQCGHLFFFFFLLFTLISYIVRAFSIYYSYFLLPFSPNLSPELDSSLCGGRSLQPDMPVLSL